jgi:hypothetical protein
MQTSGAIPKGCGKLEINLTEDCSGPWYDISGESTSLAQPSQDRLNDVMFTLDGIGALIEGGKLQPLELTFIIVYTEIVDEAFDLLADYWISDECSPKMCVRWSPAGGNVGDEEYLVAGALFIRFAYPGVDASAGGPIPGGFAVKARKIYRSTISS